MIADIISNVEKKKTLKKFTKNLKDPDMNLYTTFKQRKF